MSTAPIHWPAEALWEAVAPVLPGFTVEVLPTIDSTNSELMRRARAGRHEPTLLVAERQTAGRGRLGRVWHSEAAACSPDAPATAPLPSLMLSLGLPMAPRDWSGLSLAVGVSVAESLQPVLPLHDAGVPRVGLKWPNDLWLSGDRKLGGILIETASFVGSGAPGAAGAEAQRSRFVVVGLGLNVLPRSAEGLSTPPGCLQEIDAALDAPQALLRIVPALVQALQVFERDGFAPVQPRFARRDVLQGRAVTLSDGQAGTAHGVGPDGALTVHTAGGMLAVTSAEISVRPVAMGPV